jgi:predicted lysophospholipase L1 biosynthesis ABC-type transport system permease subunit
MKKKIRKEILSFGLFLVIGVVLGVIIAVLNRTGVISLPDGEGPGLWVIVIIIAAGLVLTVGTTVVYELLKKSNKKYEIEEKDERNQALYSKAGFHAWLANIAAISAIAGFMFSTGFDNSYLILLGILFGYNIISYLVLIVYNSKKM